MNKQREQRMLKFLEHGIDPKDIRETHNGFILFNKYIVAIKVDRYRIRGRSYKGRVDWWPFIKIDFFLKKIIKDNEEIKKDFEELPEKIRFCPCCGERLEDYD